MESPLNPAVWRFMFRAAVGGMAVGMVYSLLRERYDILHTMDEYFEALRLAAPGKEKVAALEAIQGKIQSELLQKKASAGLSSLRFAGELLEYLKLDKEGSNADSVSAAVKVVLKVFGNDAKGRKQLYLSGGYRILLSTLSEAHRQGRVSLLEEVSDALNKLSAVVDSEVVLDSDVPEGAEGAMALASIPATAKMLRILDPSGPVVILSNLTGIFANICTLQVGAAVIAKGTDGHSGMSFFLRLLDHGNNGVVAHCMLAVRYLARAGFGHEELATEESVRCLSNNLTVHADPRVTNSILTIIVIMIRSKQRDAFFSILAASDIISSFFDIWCRGSDKVLRERAEVLVQLLESIPQCHSVVHENIDSHRLQILERRAKDEELREKQIQQMRQQQMMQQMMMEQMGGGMDLAQMMGGGM